MQPTKALIEEVQILPEHPDPDTIYVRLPKILRAHLDARLDRERGCQKYPEEQEIFFHSTALVLGCGGMGGHIALTLVRRGWGTVIMVDPDTYERTNRNRQVGATESTEGDYKVFATGKMACDIAPDVTIILIPQSFDEEILEAILPYTPDNEIDLIYDEIELFTADARLTAHLLAEEYGIPLINCNTILYAAHYFLFDYSRKKRNEMRLLDFVAEYLDADREYVEDWLTRKKVSATTAAEDADIRRALVAILIPEVSEYSLMPEAFSTIREWNARLAEGVAIVTATNPLGAASLALSQGALLRLAKASPIKRKCAEYPEKGYFRIDFAALETKIVRGTWFLNNAQTSAHASH